MNKKQMRVIVILAGLVASTTHASPGFTFLQLGADVRASGLGGALMATTNQSDAVFGNPAGMAGLRNLDLSAMHSTWIEQMSLESVALAIPSSLGTFGVGALWLSTPGLERRGADRQLLGTFGATSWSGVVSYGTQIDASFALGINFKLIGENLDDVSATGFAFDLGSQWRAPVEGLTIGAAIQHLGPSVTYLTEATALPTTIALGVNYQLPLGLLLAADLTHQWGEQITTLHMGTELTPYGPLALRVGYSVLQGSGNSTIMIGSLPVPTGFVGGVGIAFGSQTLDYAVVPVAGFGLTHRLGVRASW